MEDRAGETGDLKKEEPTKQTSSTAQAKTPAEDFADVPDPDEDDLDDLDDMLDEFSAVKVDSKQPEALSGPGRPYLPSVEESNEEIGRVLGDDEFAKQLQAGMADLLGEIENSPEMQAQFETVFNELSAATGTESQDEAGAESSAPGPSVPGADASFQETIRRTMERMQASGDQATAAATAEGSDDFLAELMKQIQTGSVGGEGNEEEFSKMLMGMMEQLTNKEILYEPMKELNEKFPEWLDKNKDKTPADDLKRYEEQQAIVKEIVAKFEETGYSDSNAADREYIVDRMQKMQAAGSPPSDLVGDMPTAQDALNAPDSESCNPQ